MTHRTDLRGSSFPKRSTAIGHLWTNAAGSHGRVWCHLDVGYLFHSGYAGAAHNGLVDDEPSGQCPQEQIAARTTKVSLRQQFVGDIRTMGTRRVLLAGATGLVGAEILRGLLADSSVTSVCSLGRRKPALEHVKLTALVVDFANLPHLPDAEEVYLALGTTIKAAGSQGAFRAVDFEANLAVAKAALVCGVRRVGLVSAMGADARSSVFYSRVKGELEEALGKLPFEGLVIARPSLLVGDRERLGQTIRLGERIGFWLGNVLRPLIPSNYVPIEAAKVAATLLAAVPTARGKRICLSGEMQLAPDRS